MKQRGMSPARRNSLVRTPVRQHVYNRPGSSLSIPALLLHCSCRYRQSQVEHCLMPGPKWQLPDLPQRGQVLFRMASPGGVSCKQCCRHTVYLVALCSHWHVPIAAYQEVLQSMVSQSSRRRPERLLWRAAHADVVLHSPSLPGARLRLHQAQQSWFEPHSNRRCVCLLTQPFG